ncbi:hypothetical protein ACHAXA_011072 [Cyclostephanos tholiformis]|uniref:Dihydroorotate dehydrogenase (quinone), mitochondrial n=1 Tax=Cyclostephanos tholiformis TaxID=382380 RepID=A0ABD3RVU0_9STRA
MAFQQRVRTTALGAAAAVALVEVTTHLPSEGRSSLAYHRFFDGVVTPLARRLLDPELAHHVALDVVRLGLAPRLSREGGGDAGGDGGGGRIDMSVEILGTGGGRKIRFPGPIGLAAGFDKDGSAMPGLFDMGFSFVEIGSVTPLPQPGNARPRSFRLVEDRGVINRFGFNSEGVKRVGERLADYRREFGGRGGDIATIAAIEKEGGSKEGGEGRSNTAGDSILWAMGWAWNRLMTTMPRTGVLGVNLGKNKTSEDDVEDYTVGIRELGPYADYLVINVSSPNTPGLRSLQQREPLRNLLECTMKARDEFAPHALLFVKLSPDLTIDDMADVATVVMDSGLDGMIVSNTTNARPEILVSNHRYEAGGLSGAPIKDRSTECIRTMYRLTEGKLPIIGVGGVGSGRDAFDKMKAGASLVQVYSMMVYEGPGLVSRIRKELAEILLENGYKSVDEVVGSSCEDIYWNRREEKVRRKMQENEKKEKEIIDL